MGPRLSAALLLPAMLLASLHPSVALAQPEGEVEGVEAEGEDELDPDVAEARRLFNEGATKFETADYAGAIELWTTAYGLVPSVPENAPVKAKLIANLAAAHERAYAVDKEVEHLNQAKILLESYADSIDDIYPDADERAREQAWVDERVGKIDAELQAIAEREPPPGDGPGPGPTEPTPERAPGRGLIIGGSALTVLGVGGLGVMAAGMVIGGQNNDIADLPTNEFDVRADRFAQGRLGNALAIAGGAAGAVLLGAGVALLVVGLKQKKAAGGATATIVPLVGPTQAGLGLVGRF